MTTIDASKANRTSTYDPAAEAATAAVNTMAPPKSAAARLNDFIAHAHVSPDLAAAQAAKATGGAGRSGMSSHALAIQHFPDAKSADAAFAAQKARLVDVNHWTDLSGVENATFGLVGSDGKPANRTAQVGDFVQIRLPGMPVYEWVQIEKIDTSADSLSIQVRPSYDPTKQPVTKDVTAHFFDPAATNTFSVEKRGNDVQVRVHGEDERANTGAHSGGTIMAARNRIVSEAAWGVQRPIPGTTTQVNGMQQHQWNVFSERLSQVK